MAASSSISVQPERAQSFSSVLEARMRAIHRFAVFSVAALASTVLAGVGTPGPAAAAQVAGAKVVGTGTGTGTAHTVNVATLPRAGARVVDPTAPVQDQRRGRPR